jgi:trk system potassium uptake protein TrkA
MYVVIAGGGKVGYYLSKTLIPYKHKIAVIERQDELCRKIANELEIPVINGDGTLLSSLSEADTQNADIFIAVTGKDEDNLVACQLAKRKFGVKRTIARVNNPKNIKVFEHLGVDTAVSSTQIIADLIEQEVDFAGIKTLMKLKNDKIILSEVHISEDSPVCSKALKDIYLPAGCILVSVIRDEEVIIPNGFTVLHAHDYVIAVSSSETQYDLRKYLLGKAE